MEAPRSVEFGALHGDGLEVAGLLAAYVAEEGHGQQTPLPIDEKYSRDVFVQFTIPSDGLLNRLPVVE